MVRQPNALFFLQLPPRLCAELRPRRHHSALPNPAGELLPPTLRALDKVATLVLGGVHMSDISSFPYDLLYHERVIRSVVNHTREDGKDFLELAASIPVRTKVEVYLLADANRALQFRKK